jgi:hypothetical protein
MAQPPLPGRLSLGPVRWPTKRQRPFNASTIGPPLLLLLLLGFHWGAGQMSPTQTQVAFLQLCIPPP